MFQHFLRLKVAEIRKLENCRFIRHYLPFDNKKRNNWCGLAFKMLCLNHIPQIKESLKIGGVQTSVYSWRTPASAEKGAQIDMVIDRADNRVNLCEMKFSRTEYTLSKSEREKLEHRLDSFISYTKTKRTIRLTLITSFGLQKNIHSSIVQDQVTLNDLFFDSSHRV